MYGLDLLGISKYPNTALRDFPRGFALGAFSNCFGDALPAIENIVKAKLTLRVRLHLDWDDEHNYLDKFDLIKREALRVRGLVARYPNIDWRISGACEHKLNSIQAIKLRDIVLAACPGVIYVNSPLRKQGGAMLQASANVVNEIHKGDGAPPGGHHDFSYDGANCVDSDIVTDLDRWKSCQTFYLWGSQANGRMTTQDPTPRPERRAWPTTNELDSWVALTKKRGTVALPKGWIYKSHSDQHSVPPAPRERKPVWISPVKASAIELRAKNGHVVDHAPYYSPYTDGVRHRYYCTDWGYLLAEKARKISGSPVCDVVVNGKKVGTLNPAFRYGEWR